MAEIPKPLPFVLVVIYLGVGGVLGILVSMLLLGSSTYFLLGVLGFALSIGEIAGAYGLWTRQDWSRTLVMFVMVGGTVWSVLEILLGDSNEISSVFIIGLNIAVIVYLNSAGYIEYLRLFDPDTLPKKNEE